MEAAKSWTAPGVRGGLFIRMSTPPKFPEWHSDISIFTPDSNAAQETYPLGGSAAIMSEFKGKVNARGIDDFKVVVTNTPYNGALEIPRDFFRRDQTAVIERKVNEFSRQGPRHWRKVVTQKILDGETNNAYDDQTYFSTTHSSGLSGTQDNDLSIDISDLPVPTAAHGSTTSPSADEAGEIVMLMIEKMLSYKDDVGEPMNEDLLNFMVMVPTNFWKAFTSAVSDKNLSSGRTNTLVGVQENEGISIKVVSNTRLTWTTKLVLFASGPESMALIKQQEGDMEIGEELLDSAHYKNTKNFRWQADASRGTGYGLWQHAVLATLT